MNFEDYWNQALAHYGDVRLIEQRYPVVTTKNELVGKTDAYYLSTISRRVFRAGMRHSVIDSRWPAFEEAFWQFDPLACQLIDDTRFEVLMQNSELIRHWGKMKTIPINAQMVVDLSKEHGSFGYFIANWPEDRIIELWQVFKKKGAFLGGDGGASLLRMVGKDTFVLAGDVVRALINAGVVTKKPTSMRDLNATQDFFNLMHEQSGLNYSAISMVLAMSIGPS